MIVISLIIFFIISLIVCLVIYKRKNIKRTNVEDIYILTQEEEDFLEKSRDKFHLIIMNNLSSKPSPKYNYSDYTIFKNNILILIIKIKYKRKNLEFRCSFSGNCEILHKKLKENIPEFNNKNIIKALNKLGFKEGGF